MHADVATLSSSIKLRNQHFEAVSKCRVQWKGIVSIFSYEINGRFIAIALDQGVYRRPLP